DSNTYGVLVPHGQAWPPQLELAWNGRHADQRVEVLNLGYPGNSSSGVLKSLPLLLDRFHPQVVMIMIGANDWWTVPVAADDAASAHEHALAILARLPALLHAAPGGALGRRGGEAALRRRGRRLHGEFPRPPARRQVPGAEGRRRELAVARAHGSPVDRARG